MAVIIDIHTHIFPDELAERALSVLSHNCSCPAYLDGTCADLVASMQRAGVDRSVIMPIATKPSQARGINQWAAEISHKRPEIIAFGTIHPRQEDWRAEIDAIVAEGFRGVKLHPDYQKFFVDDPELMPIYRTLAEAGLIVLFHAGVDIGLPPPVHCTPDRLARALDAVPELTVIAAHMGGWQCWDDVERYLVGRNVYFDTSFSLSYMGAERMAELIRAHGAGRVLFGTDSPWTDQAAEVEGIRALPFDEETLSAVLGGNASRLLGDAV